MPLNVSRQTRRLVQAVATGTMMLAILPPAVAQERVYLTEFMAANVRTLADRDRDYSDWIELHNAGAAAVNLDGWFLTDDRKELKKWRFPAVPIGPGEYLLVFASGKDRRAPGAELHTNFKLDAERGYLGLIKPDGATASFEFAPEYPRQVAGASYGLDMADKPAPLLSAAASKRVLVPAADIGMNWAAPEFNDSAWLAVTNSIGYDSNTNSAGAPGTNLREQMLGRNASVFLRVPFDVADPSFETLRLRLRYEDGFIAYLNGWEVARRNAPAKALWNSTATTAQAQRASVLLVENFDAASGPYITAQADVSTKPKAFPADVRGGSGGLRLVNGRVNDQLNSIAFPQTAPGLFETVVADFDFRWKGTGEGTERLAFLLIPVAQYGATGAGADLAAFREIKDPKLPGLFAVQLLHNVQSGEKALTVHWDRVKRGSADLPSASFGQRVFHHAQVRLQHTEQGALVSITLTSDAHDAKKQTFTPISQVLIPGLRPYQARVQFVGRIGHWDQTIDLDNLRVESTPASQHSAGDFDLSNFINVLRPGRNVLALHGLNNSANDPSFLLAPELAAGYSAVRSKEVRYFATPTPRAGNRDGLRGLSPPPVFSKRGGVFIDTVKLELSAREGTVRYTLDGSEPNASSQAYAEPIALTGSTLVKAKTFAPGLLPSGTAAEAFTLLDESAAGFTSNLPLLILNPFGQYLSANNRSTVSMRFINAGQGRNSLAAAAEFDGRASVNVRGFSTLRQPKNSLTLRLTDENNDKVKASLFGLPKESDWVLYAPYADKTLMRDALAYELSNQMGRYAPRTRFVEVFMDRTGGRLGQRDYMGVYVLVEKIKRGKSRVNVTELTASDTTEPNITGGYIFKRDHSERYEQSFRTSQGNHFYYVDPNPENMSREQMNWLKSYMHRFEQALYGPDFRDPNRGYAAFLDVDAFIDQHWLIEMSKNIDGFRYSAYLHKDRGGKLNVGPAWDWNLSFGNANYHDGSDPAGWYTEQMRDTEICWFRRLSEDPEFMQRAIDRWGELRRDVLATARVLGRVDEMAALLNEAQARNFRRWPVLGRRVHPNDFVGDSYEEEIQWMKQWIQKRLAWIDSQFIPPPTFTQTDGNVTLRGSSGKIYYTFDGSDPRLPGGGVSPKAKAYSAPIPTGSGVGLMARAQQRNGWSSPVKVAPRRDARPPSSGK
jgi:hypothetical protein